MNKINAVQIGLALKSLRLAAGQTLGEVEKHTSISQSQLSRTETGARSIEFIEAIILCVFFKIELNQLVSLAEKMEEMAKAKQKHNQIKQEMQQQMKKIAEQAIK